MCENVHAHQGETVGMVNARPMRALGRQFALGELYDSRREESIETFLWGADEIKKKTKKEDMSGTELQIVGGAGSMGKAEDYGLDAEMRVGILAGLVSVGGSGGYQTASASCTQASVTAINFTAEEKMHRLILEPGDQQKMQSAKSLKATHVVTKILYGAEVIFAFAADLTETGIRQLMEGEVDGRVVEPTTASGVQAKAHVKKETAQSLKIELNGSWFSGDVQIDTVPTNTEEAVAILKALPEKVKNCSPVPIKVWLMPLPGYRDVMRPLSNALISETEAVLQGLESYLTCLDKKLVKHPVTRKLPETCRTIQKFKKLVEDYQHDIKEKVADMLPKIRAKTHDEECLEHCIDKHKRSPYSYKMLQEWLDVKEQELEVLERFLADGNIIDANEVRGLQLEFRCVVAMVLTTHTQASEPFLKQLDDYFPGRQESKEAKNPTESRFVTGKFQNPLLDFRTGMEANKDNAAVKFVTVEEGREDEETPAVQLRVYEDEELVATDCLLPDPVQHLKVHRGILGWVKAEWEAPSRGEHLVSHYKVQRRNTGSDDTWETADSDLVKKSDTPGKWFFNWNHCEVRLIPLCGDVMGPDCLYPEPV